MTNYILRQGTDAYRRLTLLAEAKWPSTSALLERLPVRPGMKCMDVGSGTGAVSLALARIVAPTGRVVGVDTDTLLLDLAREKAAEEGLPAEFLEIDVTKSELPRGFDLVYARFL